MENPSPTPSRRGYPLGALFVLTAVCAIASAMVAPVVRDIIDGEIDAKTAAECMLGVGFGVGVFGASIGLFHHRRLMGLLTGGVAGGGLGVVAGLIVLAKRSDTSTIFTASLVGSIVIVALAAIIRFQSKSSRQ